MNPELGLLEFASGALIILGIFAAFMVWAIFPILPFFLMGAIYAAGRYGLPALGRAAVAAEDAALAGIRRVLQPVAVWVLQSAPVAADHGDGKRRR
jgi:hypothetical protein